MNHWYKLDDNNKNQQTDQPSNYYLKKKMHEQKCTGVELLKKSMLQKGFFKGTANLRL